MGMCDQGPAMLVNDQIYTKLTPNKINEIVADYRKRGSRRRRRQGRRRKGRRGERRGAARGRQRAHLRGHHSR